MNTELIIGLLALIVAILSLIVSWFFSRKDHERRRKQATIEYFETMTSSLFETQAIFNDKLSQLNMNIADLESHPELLKGATAVLSAFERLCVGVNTGVFDFDMLDRMAGSYLIFLYSRFTPYIEKIRKDASRTNSYKEFERVVSRIKNNRNPLQKQGAI